ncbi:hypothetical protein [Paludisphaera mucosa]|uniref:Uncharacterized protein n=1 Tax=Paludisphaera mucosa TaxID=3030827 RepID=A0ABT6FFM1_9BACT|nr:hypothetical protein [Paludisphaera mucosa]MDG3006375.1 hypothetical protein [Paludisphaera mucosa]
MRYATLPRILDMHPARRPGGAQGAARPDGHSVDVGAPIVVWLKNGDCIQVEAEEASVSDPKGIDFAAVPWGLVEWWIPT